MNAEEIENEKHLGSMDQDMFTQNKTIFVAGIADRISDNDLAGLFGTFGVISNIHQPIDHASGRRKGFGFIEFEDPEDVDHAVFNYDNTEVYGKVLFVRKAKAKKRFNASTKAVWEVKYDYDDEV